MLKKLKKLFTSTFLTVALVSNTVTIPVMAETTKDFIKISFEDGENSCVYEGDNAALTIVQEGNTDGDNALKVDFAKADWPGLKIRPIDEGNWNFGVGKSLSFNVKNPMNRPQAFFVKFSEGDISAEKAVIFKGSINAGETAEFYTALSQGQLNLGMQYLPPTGNGNAVNYAWGEKNIDLSNITMITFWLLYNTEPATLIFDDIDLINDPSTDLSYLDDLVDKYGQYTKETWEGKVTSDAQLVQNAVNEEDSLNEELAQITASNKLSKYGGWKNEDLRQPATGHFYVTKINGKWAYVDPDGYPYISTGMDIIRFDDMLSWVTGRENMFADLPAKDGELGDHYKVVANTHKSPNNLQSGDAYNFYTANLERKYGENYVENWKDTVVKRSKAWGFTSFGNWSDPDLFFGKGNETQMPYVANGWVNGDYAKIRTSNEYWGPIADPFDPEFRTSVAAMADRVKGYGVNEDPWCNGIYVDNEISWGNPANKDLYYAVVKGVFNTDAGDANSFAKKAYIEFLKNKYLTIGELNTAWGTSIASWQILEAPYTGLIGDSSELLYIIGDQYFKVVSQEVKKKLPNILYLGARMADWGTSIELQKACAKYADVVSFNNYHDDVNQEWMNFGQYDKPVIIGEFHFNATDHGQFAIGLNPVRNQAERGQAYKNYMESVFMNDYVVGAHWFQYYDQPVLGRAWDGENNNTGFVDVTDTPYTELVAAAKEIHSQQYEIKFNKISVNSISLDKTNAAISASNPTLKLNVSIAPADADNKNVKWESSNTKVADVDSEGNVTAKADGYATIKVSSIDNPFAATSCGITVTGFETGSESNFPKISFEDGEDIVYNLEGGNKKASGEIITTSGVTDGTKAMKVTVDPLNKTDDSMPSMIQFINSSGTWSFGATGKLELDVTNPNDYGIQLRVNVIDESNALRTYYFKFTANQSRHLVIDNFGASAAKWENDGFWGAEAGLQKDKIKLITAYLWEVTDVNNPIPSEITSSSFIIDKLCVPINASSVFNKISFENGEEVTYNFEGGNKKATGEVITNSGVTDGTTSLKVTVDPLNKSDESMPSMLQFTKNSGTWDFGTESKFEFDIKNPNDYPVQLRVNVMDESGALRTYYFGLAANQDRHLIIDNFEASSAKWESDGFWGAENGLQRDKIKLITAYLWEFNSPNNPLPFEVTFSSFIIDNIKVTRNVTEVISVNSISIDETDAVITADSPTLKLNAAVGPENATNKNVKWETSNARVATVDNSGNVTAKANGSVTIRVTSLDNEFTTTSCGITITGFNTTPSVPPTTPTVPTIPETATTTNTDTAVVISAINGVTGNGKVNVDVNDNKSVAKEIFDAFRGTDKTVTFKQNSIEWSFNGKDITNATKTIDMTVKIAPVNSTETANKAAITEKVKNENVLVVSFANNGQLPGKAKVRVKLDSIWLVGKNKDDISIYYYNETTKAMETIATGLKVDAEGYVTFEITHNSDYIVTDKDLTKIPEVPTTPEQPKQVTIVRLGGANRYETSVKVSQAGWKTSDSVVLARGDEFADALCAAPLAKQLNAPILLTAPKVLDASVKAELQRLKVKKVYIVGGTGAVSTAVENAVKALGVTVERISGSDRYATSLAIANKITTKSQVFLSTGASFADALSISSYAAATGSPILLTGKNQLAADVAKFIKNNNSKVYAIGGTGVIADSVIKSVAGAERIAGADRYATNVAILNKFAAGFNFSKVYFATGKVFADALSGSALAAITGAPVVLVDSVLPQAANNILNSKSSVIAEKYILGGEAVLPNNIIKQ